MGGLTSLDPYRAVKFNTEPVGRHKAAKKKTDRFRVEAWGIGAPLHCAGPEVPYQGYQNFPRYVGATGASQFGPDQGGPLVVRNRRFSEHAFYDVVVYDHPKRIEYTVTGQFTSRTTASGTAQVTDVWDGGTTTCASGPFTWSACFLPVPKQDVIEPSPPCSGIVPGEGPPPP